MPDLVIAFEGPEGVIAFIFGSEALDDWPFLSADQKEPISKVVEIIANGRRPPDIERLYPGAPTDARDILKWSDHKGLEFWFEEASPELRARLPQHVSSPEGVLPGLKVGLPTPSKPAVPNRAYRVYRIRRNV